MFLHLLLTTVYVSECTDLRAKVYQMTYGSDISQCIKIDKIITHFITFLIKGKKQNQQSLVVRLTFYFMLMHFCLTKTFFRIMLPSDLLSLISDLDTLTRPRHDKTCLQGFRQSSFQTGLLSYTD